MLKLHKIRWFSRRWRKIAAIPILSTHLSTPWPLSVTHSLTSRNHNSQVHNTYVIPI